MESTNEYLVADKKKQDGKEKVYTHEDKGFYSPGAKKSWFPFSKISWPAIFAGVVVTAVTQLLFSLLGIGIGMGIVDPLKEQNPVSGLGIGSVVWWSVTMLIALFLGGFTTGRLFPKRSKNYLTWHGLLTWSMFTVLSFFILTTGVGMLISGFGNVLGTVATAGASAAQNKQLDLSEITRDARNFFMTPGINERNHSTTNSETSGANSGNGMYNGQPSSEQGTETGNADINGMSRTSDNGISRTSENTTATTRSMPSQQARINSNYQRGNMALNNQYLIEDVQSFFKTGNIQSPEEREKLINNIANQTGVTHAEATRQVDKWMVTYQNLKESARINGDKAARAISISSFVAFFALLLGALVTVWGARVTLTSDEIIVHKNENQFSKVASN